MATSREYFERMVRQMIFIEASSCNKHYFQVLPSSRLGFVLLRNVSDLTKLRKKSNKKNDQILWQ